MYICDEKPVAFSAPGHDFIFAGDRKEQVPVMGKTDEMLNYLANQDVHELSPVPLRNIRMTDDCKVEIRNGTTQIFTPTATGLQSMCEHVPSLNYYGVRNDIDNELFDWTHPMNERFGVSSSKVKPIIRDGHLAALRSQSFALVSNYDVAKDSINNMPDGYKFLGGFVTQHKFKMVFINSAMNIVLNGNEHMPGFVQLNSEVGSNALSLEWMLYTSFCTNMALFGARMLGGTRMVHRGNLNERTEKLMTDFIPRAADINDFFRRSLPLLENTYFADKGAFVRSYSDKLRVHLGKKRTESFLEDRSNNNYFQEWSRLTSYARDLSDLDKRTDLEKVGGWMLSYVDKNSDKIIKNTLN